MAKFKAETAAHVAAQLTLARSTLLAGALAGRAPGSTVNFEERMVEKMFLHYLAFASEVDPKSPDYSPVLDLSPNDMVTD